MEAVLTGLDSVAMFRNSQGATGRGTLVHITRSTAVFEVYNPYSIIQLSEVLTEVRIMRGERVIYNGRASVSNLVPTGLMVIVSVTLLDAWSDLSGLRSSELLQLETKRFVNDWEASQDLRPSYRIAVSQLRNFLGELSHWLDEAEAGAFDQSDNGRLQALKNEFYEEVKVPLEPKVTTLFSDFEAEASRVPPEEVMAHKAYARRELHPLTLCSPFVHRTFTKPLGYAGDYEMVNMMLGETRIPITNTYANIVHEFHINTGAPEAHRNRIGMLEARLRVEARRVSAEGRPFKVLNVGCGPSVEVQRFIRKEALSNFAVFHLMDFSRDALEHAEKRIQEAVRESAHRPVVKFIHKSIDALLKEVYEGRNGQHGHYDFVYSAGVFDYFTHQTCRNLTRLLHDWVSPDGLLTVTNVHPKNPNRYGMEHLLEWYLNYRDELEMATLAPLGCRREVTIDATGLNVFLDVRKDVSG